MPASHERIDQIRQAADVAINNPQNFGRSEVGAIQRENDALKRFEQKAFSQTQFDGKIRIWPCGTWQPYIDGLRQHARRLFGAMIGEPSASETHRGHPIHSPANDAAAWDRKRTAMGLSPSLGRFVRSLEKQLAKNSNRS